MPVCSFWPEVAAGKRTNPAGFSGIPSWNCTSNGRKCIEDGGNSGGDTSGGGPPPTNNQSSYRGINLKDQKTKSTIRELLTVIDDDCLGKVLINTLGSHGIQISYDPNVSWGVTEVNTGNIRWGDNGAVDYILYEELFHAYQVKSGNFDSAYRGSMEIEAKVAVWKYMNRIGKGFNSDEKAWDLIGEFAQNPTYDNYAKAMNGIAQMGYWEPNYVVNRNLYTLPNFNRINPCND